MVGIQIPTVSMKNAQCPTLMKSTLSRIPVAPCFRIFTILFLQVHFFAGSEDSFCGRSHVDIALESKELEICPYSSSAYYLFGRLAQLELDLSEMAQNFLLDAGLDMMACPGKGGIYKLHHGSRGGDK